MNKITITLVIFSLILSFASSANAAFFSGKDLIAPDSSFSFLQTWKESIQTFFTFGLENKAKQYLHLAGVRLNEYKKLLDEGKTDIAEKVLEKYQKQLNHALDKAKELKNEGKDIKDLSKKIGETVSKHLEVLQENLQKVPEQAKKGLENAIENSQKQIEKVLGKKIEKDETLNWKTYRNEKYGFEVKYPKEFTIRVTNENLQNIHHSSKKSNQVEINALKDKINDLEPDNLKDLNFFYSYVDKFINKLATAGFEDESNLYSKESLKFNGYNATAIKDKSFPNSVSIMVYHNYQAFLISYSAFSEYESVINQILSTFKFIPR